MCNLLLNRMIGGRCSRCFSANVFVNMLMMGRMVILRKFGCVVKVMLM